MAIVQPAPKRMSQSPGMGLLVKLGISFARVRGRLTPREGPDCYYCDVKGRKRVAKST